MPSGRRKRSPAHDKGLAPGESLQRFLVPKNVLSDHWAWVGTEVSHPADITLEHRLLACGLSPRSKHPFCPNKYATTLSEQPSTPPPLKTEVTVPEEDEIIVISDNEEVKCNKKSCKGNPNCLNYLGQDKWEDEGKLPVFVEKLVWINQEYRYTPRFHEERDART
jgi:ubiquitin carboxyl-terminal hydrolase 48